MEGEEWRKNRFVKTLEFITLLPGITGLLTAFGVFFGQFWRWLHYGEWKEAPIAQFVPKNLVDWAVAKEGGLLGLKNLVLTLLSLHASLWFFATGLFCSFLLYEIAKPWLKATSDS
jgi:hypothetical protein